MTTCDLIFLTANDIHVSDGNPRSRIDDFKESVFDKIGQLKSASVKLKADAVLMAGDLYNLKKPIHNSHTLNRELIEAFKQFKCPIYAVPGNHDLSGNNLDSITSQPIGVLFEDGTLHNLASAVTIVKDKIDGITQQVISKKDLKVSLVGIPYIEDLDLDKLAIPPKGDCQVQICLMHVYAGPQAGNVHKERLYGYDELAKLGPDIFVLGHYHIDQGIRTMHGKTFINIGSISRGILSEENIDHKPKIGFLKISLTDGKISVVTDSILLKVKPVGEIFDLNKREEEKRESAEIQKFIEELVKEAKIGDSTTLESVLDAMNLSKIVRDRTVNFIQEATTIN